MEELAEKNFKTSYVEVYPDSSNCLLSTLYISKHLMLKFIVLTSLAEPDILYFKTSYVEVYLGAE